MKKFLRWFGRSVLALSALVAVVYVVENWRGKHAWEKYRHEREAKGDSFEWSSIVPPPVPDAENFAATPLFAELFPKPPEHPRLDAIKLPECPKAAGNWSVGRAENLAAWQSCFSNENLLAALSKYDPILSEIAEAGRQPKCRFPIRYDDHVYMLLPHLGHLRQLARDYRLRALAELAAGQSDAALADVRLCLRLASELENEPVLISFLVRIAILDIAIQPVWEGLVEHRWSASQLVTLQTEFERVEQFNTFAKVIRGERIFAYSALRTMLNESGEIFAVAMTGGNLSTPFLMKALGWVVPTEGWVYQNILTVDRFYTETYLPTIDWEHRRISPLAIAPVKPYLHTRIKPYNMLCNMMAINTVTLAKKVAQSQTALDEVAVACALERYRLAKGELPDKLDALVPSFIVKVPHDVINGQPPRYRRTAVDQFLLYSIGWNETDDGGQIVLTSDKPSRPDFSKGDWVWSSVRHE